MIKGIIVIGAIPEATLGSLNMQPANSPTAFPQILYKIKKSAHTKNFQG